VVDAYWIGNPLLARVGAAPFHDSLRSRFGGRMDRRSFDWLAGAMRPLVDAGTLDDGRRRLPGRSVLPRSLRAPETAVKEVQ
jgi:hypothetical protein